MIYSTEKNSLQCDNKQEKKETLVFKIISTWNWCQQIFCVLSQFTFFHEIILRYFFLLFRSIWLHFTACVSFFSVFLKGMMMRSWFFLSSFYMRCFRFIMNIMIFDFSCLKVTKTVVLLLSNWLLDKNRAYRVYKIIWERILFSYS